MEPESDLRSEAPTPASPPESSQPPLEVPATPAHRGGSGIPLWVFALVLLAGLAALFWPHGERISFARSPRPVDLAGESVALESRFGRVTLLHFWASWCPPCLTEIPALKRLVRDFPPGPTGLSYALVSVEDDQVKAKALLGDLVGLNLFDPDWAVAHGYGTEKLPETYLIVDGNVVDKFVGATNWDDPALRERLRSVLAGTAR